MRFGCMTLLQGEENRCTVLRNTIDKKMIKAPARVPNMYIMSQLKKTEIDIGPLRLNGA